MRIRCERFENVCIVLGKQLDDLLEVLVVDLFDGSSKEKVMYVIIFTTETELFLHLSNQLNDFFLFF